VPILAFADAKNRTASKKSDLRAASDAQARAHAKSKHAEAVEPAPALGFKASSVFRLAVQFE
jgi:hypothetical protein